MVSRKFFKQPAPGVTPPRAPFPSLSSPQRAGEAVTQSADCIAVNTHGPLFQPALNQWFHKTGGTSSPVNRPPQADTFQKMAPQAPQAPHQAPQSLPVQTVPPQSQPATPTFTSSPMPAVQPPETLASVPPSFKRQLEVRQHLETTSFTPPPHTPQTLPTPQAGVASPSASPDFTRWPKRQKEDAPNFKPGTTASPAPRAHQKPSVRPAGVMMAPAMPAQVSLPPLQPLPMQPAPRPTFSSGEMVRGSVPQGSAPKGSVQSAPPPMRIPAGTPHVPTAPASVMTPEPMSGAFAQAVAIELKPGKAVPLTPKTGQGLLSYTRRAHYQRQHPASPNNPQAWQQDTQDALDILFSSCPGGRYSELH